MILHLVSDAVGRTGDRDAWEISKYIVALADQAIEAGIDMFQIREPSLPTAALVSLTEAVLRRAEGSALRVIVNDRADVAIAVGAVGVHLKEQSIAPSRVRAIAPSGFLIGRSVHAVPAAGEVEGADYLIAGTVWPTSSKPAGHLTLGLDGLADIVADVKIPVLAIGGVTLERVEDVARTGAQGVAAIGLFATAAAGPRKLRALTQELRQRFDRLATHSYHGANHG